MASSSSGNSSSLIASTGQSRRGKPRPGAAASRIPTSTSDSNTTARAGHHNQVASA